MTVHSELLPSPFLDALDDAVRACRVLLKAAHALPDDQAVAAKIHELYAIATQLHTNATQPTTANPVLDQPPPPSLILPPKRFEELQPTAPFTKPDDQWASTDDSASQPSVWSGFYNKTLRERLDVLALMHPRLQRSLKQHEGGEEDKLGELPVRTANLMIENCIGVLGVPLGLGLNFVIDGRHMSVPMAVEEPSVVAAASSAAKLIATSGGFSTATTGNIMTSQIQLVDTPDLARAVAAVAAHRDRLLQLANATLCPNMKQRGGGAVDIYCRVVHTNRATHTSDWYTPCKDELATDAAAAPHARYLVVHVDVDVCEAMGANVVNTVAEGLAAELAQLTHSRRAGLRILTNLCMQRRARATFEIPVHRLGWKGVSGDEVAARVLEAYHFAAADPYRAVTHNKGILNGVDAVALATGQDWRAIEAAAHCYASRHGTYTSLSSYHRTTNARGEAVLVGSLELPLAVGSKGGALQTHPGYRATHAILGQPDARTLSGVLASVGLAQNFAAVRALAVTGIQQGHMALHARNIATAAGAPSELVSEVCTYMLGRQRINAATAKEYLEAHQVFSEIHSTCESPPLSPSAGGSGSAPSMFYVEIPVPQLDGAVSVNIAFASVRGHPPQYIAIQPKARADQELQRQLLGDKGFNQLEKMFRFLADMRSIVAATPLAVSRANVALQNKLQLLSILINILVFRLMEVHAAKAGAFMRHVLASAASLSDLDGRRLLEDHVDARDRVLSTGLSLFLALCQVLQYHLEQDVAHALLRQRLATEQWALLRAVVHSFDLVHTADASLEAFMAVHAKRWQATMLLLVDSLALASELVTPPRLDAIRAIGEYMEWEGTIAHDLARYARAAADNVPNAFVTWLRQHGHSVDAGAVDSQVVAAFCRVADACAAKKWAQIEAQAAASPAWDVFSLAAVQRVAQLVRDVYADRSGQRPRIDSF